MNFTTAPRVLQTIRSGDEVEWVRGTNRVKINNAANCVPPLDPDEAQRLNIKINVNWGELMILLAHARRQYHNAFWQNRYFFRVNLPLAPANHQSEWGAFITEEINKPMRDSLPYFELHRSKWAAVTCHGVGPQTWMTRDRWLPKYVAIEDLRIPTDTTLDFENLIWFAIRYYWTPFELADAITGIRSKGWDKESVAKIIKNYKEINFEDPQSKYDYETTPEKFAELLKQDGGYYASDAMPAIPLYNFYFKDWDEDGREAWFMKIVPEIGAIRGDSPEVFLWSSNKPIARKRSEILHCQFGDLSNKAPFLYHSVRSLGFALMEPCFYTNLARNRTLQHLLDQFNVWLRVSDPIDKARAQVQEFGNFGVLRTGVNVVPANERHQVDSDLIEMAMAQLKQLQQEASASYTQAADTGTKKEQTAFETSVKLQQVNALLGALLTTAFAYEKHSYMEIARRFCLKKTNDPDVLRFQMRCQQMGIPRRWINSELWDIDPVTPLGMGNPTLAEAKAQQLMQFRPAYDQTAQAEILHEFTLVQTGDPRKAARWAPIGKDRGMSDSVRDAQQIFGTLMQGIRLQPREGLSMVEQADELLQLLGVKVHLFTQRNNMATPEEAMGLATVMQYINDCFTQIAQNPQNKGVAKQIGDAIGKLNNQIKGLAQRGQEAAQSQNGNGGLTPEAQAKIHSLMATTAAKIKAKEMSDAQKRKQRSTEFVKEQRRKDAETFANIQRDHIQTVSKARLQKDEE